MVKDSVQQEDITMVSIYGSNDRSKYIKQNLMELKGEIDSSTVIVGDFNTPPTMDRTTKDKEIKDLNNKPTRPNRCLQNILPKNNTHSFFFF